MGSAMEKGRVSRLRGIPRVGSVVSNMVAKRGLVEKDSQLAKGSAAQMSGRRTLQADGRAGAKALRQDRVRVFKEGKDAEC